MNKATLGDEHQSFEVSLVEAGEPSCLVLFAVGAGGNPERHLPLLKVLAEANCTVIAPHFERLTSPQASEDHLLLRARRMRLALAFAGHPTLPVVGIGHSIGATMLLALAGGQIWMGPERPLSVPREDRLNKLVLMTPATGFFQAPGALDKVRGPVQVWSGSNDAVTPPEQAEFLQQSLASRLQVDLRKVDKAGHFSFMNILPPLIIDPLPQREAFLAHMAAEICRYVAT